MTFVRVTAFAALAALAVGFSPAARAQGTDSCSLASNGQCDEVGIGSGACSVGTDATDCAGVGLDTCQWANDGECDEPGIGTGACTAGSDTADCRPVVSASPSGKPGAEAPPAADASPTGDKPSSDAPAADDQQAGGSAGGGSAAGSTHCMWPNDGQCDEPDIGTGLCPAGTDPDCR